MPPTVRRADTPRKLTSSDFARMMAAFEPFEDRPHVAVAVSGGGDSMALTLLADAWARARGGRLTGLSIDHGLRPDSAAEAARVGAWLAARGIAHEVLTWRGAKPESGIQEAARRARYDLLDAWCRGQSVLHLLVAHNREDQAETVVLRLQRASGPDGLAAMSAVRELTHCRVLRPLLGVARASLRNLLIDAEQPWIEDPSNGDARYARPRLRLAGQAAGVDAARLAESARRYGLARIVLERDTDRLLAEGCRFDTAGYATLRRDVLCAAPEDLALRALARVVAAVGGLPYPPRRRVLEGAYRQLTARNPAATLGRCRLVSTGADLGVFRERRNAPAIVNHAPGRRLRWDRRFDIIFADTPLTAGADLRLEALDPAMMHGLPDFSAAAIGQPPRAAYWGLPALIDAHGVFAVPHLKYLRDRRLTAADAANVGDTGFAGMRFHPLLAASAAGFFVA